jgi:hypothetical protein
MEKIIGIKTKISACIYSKSCGFRVFKRELLLQATILKLFGKIDWNRSKPLKATISTLIDRLLENNKAHILRLRGSLSVGDASVRIYMQLTHRFLSHKNCRQLHNLKVHTKPFIVKVFYVIPTTTF